jgi:hypothetical protein
MIESSTLPAEIPAQPIDHAKHEIREITRLAKELVGAMAAETHAITHRDKIRHGLVSALVGTQNSLTGKPHSATSAGEEAERHLDYTVAEDTRRACERDRIMAEARLYAMKLTAMLAVSIATTTTELSIRET